MGGAALSRSKVRDLGRAQPRRRGRLRSLAATGRTGGNRSHGRQPYDWRMLRYFETLLPGAVPPPGGRLTSAQHLRGRGGPRRRVHPDVQAAGGSSRSATAAWWSSSSRAWMSEINRKARVAGEALLEQPPPGVVDVVPAFCTVAVYYRPEQLRAASRRRSSSCGCTDRGGARGGRRCAGGPGARGPGAGLLRRRARPRPRGSARGLRHDARRRSSGPTSPPSTSSSCSVSRRDFPYIGGLDPRAVGAAAADAAHPHPGRHASRSPATRLPSIPSRRPAAGT